MRNNIVLYQFQCDFDLPNASPFCFKLETWLRMTGLAYTSQPWAPKVAPLGKAPTVGLDGDIIADTSCIIEELSERCGVNLDAALTPAQRAKALVATRTLEEHTYWSLIDHRWAKDAVWNTYRPIIGGALPMPSPFKAPVLGMMRKGAVKAGKGHGLLRHAHDEVDKRAIADVDAIADLFEGTFFLGDTPHSVDATIFAFIENLGHPKAGGAVSEHIRNQTHWATYCRHMRKRFWSDWEERMPALSRQ